MVHSDLSFRVSLVTVIVKTPSYLWKMQFEYLTNIN